MCTGHGPCHHHAPGRGRVNLRAEVIEAVTTDGGKTYHPVVGSGGFSGTYPEQDCVFLMRNLGDSAELGRAGMPCWEDAPAEAYLTLYEHAMQHNAARVARDVMALADGIAGKVGGNRVQLASLARAGTPFGVLLVRALRMLGVEAQHFSISLVRGAGVDHTALDLMRAQSDAPIVFVDGWTGKGGISRHLRESVLQYNARRDNSLVPVQLVCIADLAGTSAMASTVEDYLMPSAMLDSPMNGLLSKTFANDLPGELHGAYLYGHLFVQDLSNDFVDRITAHLPVAMFSKRTGGLERASKADIGNQRVRAKREVTRIATEYGITNEDEIKAGYNETLRAVQRRAMKSLLLKNPSSHANEALVALANQLGICVVAAPNMMFECVGICGDRV